MWISRTGRILRAQSVHLLDQVMRAPAQPHHIYLVAGRRVRRSVLWRAEAWLFPALGFRVAVRKGDSSPARMHRAGRGEPRLCVRIRDSERRVADASWLGID